VPLIAAGQESEEKREGISASASGSRSALWEPQQIQFKGCRPLPGGRDFPLESLPWGADQIAFTQIPFGVMTAEAVCRELLGYCFCKAHAIPCAIEPICVYAYTGNNLSGAFCLVMKVTPGRRAESFVQMQGISVSDLLCPASSHPAVVGSEAALRGLNSNWYAEQKARWLAELHFAGGFRGLLNSSIGNDVISKLAQGGTEFRFCDFDSFKLVNLPSAPSRDFLEAFALQSLLEIVRGSLPILQYIFVTGIEAKKAISNTYRQKSSLWNAYMRRARLKAQELSWSWGALEAAFAWAFETPAFLETSCSVILSTYALERYRKRNPQPYVPH
jgi:hypothetical protein